ncbi:Arabinose efflux permease family protein [Frankia canadensis]|uniref:Arabinose efflux permease family protein n=1 Tax=Frankia canadensis TaxID=1836972 RepID=A0A2I2KTU0_9ACTN|nr:MFS transporter [Frankia canadensis]SNQ49070.1 Arabinose efflux permease family protein [Frankia canadensis]SOU56360.1 Arabinose efflux permease family protein [Frankia canadensis]
MSQGPRTAAGEARVLAVGGPDPPISTLTDRRIRALTIGLVTIITLVAFEALAVVTVLPEVAAQLRGVSLYGWTTSAFFLGTTVGIVLAGSDADRVGPARPFAAGLLLFGAGLALATVAPTMPVLVAARGLQGLGGGAIPAVAYATIGRVYPAALRPRVFALLASAWVVPGLGGPALSGLVAAHVGWRWVFGGLLPLTVVAGLIPLRALRALPGGPPATGPDAAPGDNAGWLHGDDADEDDADRAPRDAAGAPREGGRAPVVAAVRVSAGAGLILAGLTSWSLLGLPLVAAGIGCGLGPLRRLLPAGTLLLRPGVPAAVACRGLLTWAFFGADTFVPLSITAVRHASTTTAGLAVSSATLCWTAGAWTQARLAKRVRERTLVGWGLGLVALGTAVFATVLLPGRVPLPVAIGGWGIAGLGIGMSYSTIVTLVLARTPPHRQGAASTAVALTDNLGTAFGAGVSGVAVAASQARTGAPDGGLAVAFGLTVLLGLLGSLVALRRLPAHETTAHDTTAHETATHDTTAHETATHAARGRPGRADGHAGG